MPNKSLVRASTASFTHTPRTPRFLLAGGVAACALVLPQAAFGADRRWDGGGILNSNYNWANNSNWVGGGISPLDSLFFGGTKGLTNNNNTAAGTQYNGLTFNAGAGAFILGGNSIKLGGNVTNNSTATQTINLDMELVGADRTFDAASGSLVINGQISGSKGLVKAGSGMLALTGDNTFSGETKVISGRLETSSRLALGGSSNALTIDGGSVSIQGATGRLEVGALSGFGTITAQEYATLSTTIAAGATSTFGGKIGNFYLGNGGILNVEKQGEGTLVLNGSSANGGVSSYGYLFVGAGTLEYGRNDSLAQYTSLNAGATLRAGVSGTLNEIVNVEAGAATFDTQNFNVTLASFRGAHGGMLVKKGAGLLNISSQLNFFGGGFEVEVGSLAISSDQGNQRLTRGVLVHSGATFSMGGAGALELSGLTANGQAYVNNIGATTVYGALDGSGAIYGNVLSNGVLGGMVPGMLTFGGNVTVVGKHGTSVADVCDIYGNLEYRAVTGGPYANTPNVTWALSGNSLLSDFTQTRIGGNLIFSSATSLSLAFNGIGSTVNWSDAFWSTDRSWTIWQVAGSTTGLANLTLGLADWKDAGGNLLSALRGGAGFSFGLAANGRDVVLTYSAVPAPGALGLLALAGLAGARRRRA